MVGVVGWFVSVSVTATLLAGIMMVGSAAIDDARAATAADAAALAGAAAGPEAAERAAARNGAELIGWEVIGPVTRVVVRLGSAEATAHGERLEILVRP